MKHKRSIFISILLGCAATLYGDDKWDEQQAWAENQTREYLCKVPEVRSEAMVFKTVNLADGTSLDLDLRIERPQGKGPFPVVFYVHGGAWATGSKSHFCHQSFELAKHGIAGVRMEYRLKRHGVNYPEVIGDVLDAIDFIRQRADVLDLDFTRVGLAGGSAGGHLSAIAAQLTPECICYDGFNGLYDVIDRGRSHFGGGDFTGTTHTEKKQASAFYLIRSNPPDTFLYHGTEDTTIDIEQSFRFAEAIRKKGGHAEVLVYAGVGHTFFGKEPYRSPTTKALLDHTSYVFGMSGTRPNIADYAVPAKIAVHPAGFSLTGAWEGDDGTTVEFHDDGTVDYAAGQTLQWVKSYGNLYVVWNSGHYGAIETRAADRITIGEQTFQKEKVNPAVIPAQRDLSKEWLVARHKAVADDLASRDLSQVDIVFVGDSITQGWLKEGRLYWDKSFSKELNLGVSGDRTEHVLYRLIRKEDGGTMGHLDDPRLKPRRIVLMIGTNNLFKHEAGQIVEGIVAVRDRLTELEPQARIILCSVLPTDKDERNSSLVIPVNEAVSALPDVTWLDLYSAFTDANGKQRKELFKDGVHLNEDGYRLWHDLLLDVLQ